MFTIYICSDCRCEHDTPAQADYRLDARCFDCAHLAAIAELQAAARTAASTRTSRDESRRSKPERRSIDRGRNAA